MLGGIIVSRLCLTLISAQTAMAQFEVRAPEELAVTHSILVTPIQLRNQKPVTFTAVVLNYNLETAFKTTFGPSTVFAVTVNDQRIPATHFAFGSGWLVGSADSTALEAYEVKTEPSAGLLYAVKLGNLAVDAQSGTVFAWFLFPSTDTAAIKEITIGEVTLVRSKR